MVTLFVPGESYSECVRARLEHRIDFRHEAAGTWVIAFVDFGVLMVVPDVLADEPAHCAARDNIGSVMLASRETGNTDRCGQAIRNDGHNLVRRIFMGDQRSERPHLDGMPRR